MQPNKSNETFLDERLDGICEGLIEAIDREVETLRREGLPIYIAENGGLVDLRHEKNAIGEARMRK